MILEISDDQSIVLVKCRFNHCYPYLKIDFFEKDLRIFVKERLFKPIVDSTRMLKEFRIHSQNTYNIQVNKEMKVNEIETAFEKTYGLRAQVFRKSGNVWLETTVTGNWSLEEQNRQGQLITTQMQNR